MSIEEALTDLLNQPTPAAAWRLRSELLSAGVGQNTPLARHLSACHDFLNRLVASATARQYSHFASLLDMGAVGGVALQNLLEEEPEGDWWRRLLLGGMGEGLMVFAARQYVKAWEVELEAEYGHAAWYLYEAYWQLSVRLQPDLAPHQRTALVDGLLAPAVGGELAGTQKAAYLVRLFQLLLLASRRIGDEG